MRFLMKVSIPTQVGNECVANGSLGRTIESILNDISPEAVYFAEEQGNRTGYVFCNIKDESEIPGIVEPWFLAFHARVELHPAMTRADLKKAAQGFEKAVTKYGHVQKAA